MDAGSDDAPLFGPDGGPILPPPDAGPDAAMPVVSFDACGLPLSVVNACGANLGGIEPLVKKAAAKGITMQGLAADGNYFYYADATSPGDVYGCSYQDCSCTTLATRAFPSALLSAGGNLYLGGPSGIFSCAPTGCGSTPKLLSTAATSSVVADSSSLYFGQYGEVASCPLAGCPATGPSRVATTSGRVQWLDLAGAALAYVDDEGSNGKSFAAFGCDLGHCATPASLPGVFPPYSIDFLGAVYGGELFSQDANGIVACPVTGCPPSGPRRIVDGAGLPIAASSAGLYFAVTCSSSDLNAIAVCPLSGCQVPPTVLAVWSGSTYGYFDPGSFAKAVLTSSALVVQMNPASGPASILKVGL